MRAASFSISARAPPSARAAPASAAHPGSFHQLLSELNPLQYVPVVGTIYRAVTGDTIPESARFAGSLVVSGLTGGPVGLALNVGATMLEHLLGIDPERIGDQVLAKLGIGSGAAEGATAAAPPAAQEAGPAPPSGAAAVQDASGSAPAAGRAWSSAQLTAYGISHDPRGGLTRGGESGADVLNSLELARITRPSLDANWSAAA